MRILRAPALRKTGGHAVDLFRPAMEISEKMGVVARIEELATSTERMTVHRRGVERPAQSTSRRRTGPRPTGTSRSCVTT